MTLNLDTTVRELALQLPQATRIFERLKIDYCCGGARPFGAVCAELGLDANTVMQQLIAADVAKDILTRKRVSSHIFDMQQRWRES